MKTGNLTVDVTDMRSFLKRAIVWDNVLPYGPWYGNDVDSLDRVIASGYTVVSLTIAGDSENISQAVKKLAKVRRLILANPSKFLLVDTIHEVYRAKEEGKLAVALHLEGTGCLERNIDMIDVYYRLGVRHNLLAFNQSNSAGGGCAEKNDGGLTRLGESIVREMERVGMLVDLSHCGMKTALDVMEMAKQPIIFSHSNVLALASHYRNLPDEHILACARAGGVIGISGSSAYLGDPNCAVETFVRHIDYVTQLVGSSHVALGLDTVFDANAINDWVRSRPEEWPEENQPGWKGFQFLQPELVSEIFEALFRKGYSEDAVLDIAGRNHVRVCGAVWKMGR